MSLSRLDIGFQAMEICLNGETFYYLLGRFRKPQRAQRHAEKNNTSLRLSASSAVNLFCHDPFI